MKPIPKLLSTAAVYILLIASMLFWASCGMSDDRPRPKISQEAFIDILLEMHLATTAKQLDLLNPLDTIKKERVSEKILEKYQVKKVDVLYAIDYYSAMPDTMAVLYTKMVENLSAKQAQYGH